MKTADRQLLERVRTDFVGLDTEYTLADGRRTRRTYLDSTASTLMMGAARRVMESFYRHYANTHSLLHFAAKIATGEYRWAHERILSFLGADPDRYACFFTGSGTTAGINRLARMFRDHRPDRDVVLVSLMEHHSNDLPHRKHVGRVVHVPLDQHAGGQPGCINLEALETELRRHRERVSYVAVTGVSNVTGIINPVHEVAELAHRHDALILVDGAQSVAHLPVRLGGHANPARDIDAFVFSGHKTYVPGSPGVVVCRKDILSSTEPDEVGGGMVDRVFVDRYTIREDFPDREEAGTPNIPGAIGLAAALEVLDRIGMDAIVEEETALIRCAVQRIREVSDVVLYGASDLGVCPRAASVSFNIRGLDHGLVAAVLNDYHNVAVRNECFCAHPYVKEMVMDDLLDAADEFDEANFAEAVKMRSGMVRASFGLYSSEADVDALVTALRDIVANKDAYRAEYLPDGQGNYFHRSFRPGQATHFSVRELVGRYLSQDPPQE